jgi:hypothetical protein
VQIKPVDPQHFVFDNLYVLVAVNSPECPGMGQISFSSHRLFILLVIAPYSYCRQNQDETQNLSYTRAILGGGEFEFSHLETFQYSLVWRL